MSTQRRTYWHLEALKRKPSEYEIATTRLLYHPQKGFEVNVPVADWYAQYQRNSPLACGDWEAFADPRETTYTSYTARQSRAEIFVGRMLRSIEMTRHDETLSPSWIATQAQVIAPMRYPVHGLQMIAAYFAQMAPASRITIAGLFQAADEMRRVQRLAYRLGQLRLAHPNLGADSRTVWEQAAMWQPLRELIEKLLVTWDWAECFVALNLVLKPAFDDLMMVQLGRVAAANLDDPLQKILLSLNEDCEWHREWSAALAATAIRDREENRAVIEGWIEKWRPGAVLAMDAFAPVFPDFAIAKTTEARISEQWSRTLGLAAAA